MNKIKHLAFAVAGALLVTAGFVSCDSDEANKMEENTELLLKQKANSLSIQDLGELHNLGLGYLRNNESFAPTHFSDYIIDNSIGLLNLNDFNIDLLYCKGIDSLNISNGLKEAVENNYFTNFDELNNLIFNTSPITEIEKNQIQSLQNSLNNSIINDDVLSLKNKIDEHIMLYESTSWEEGQGTLIGGYLYVMKGSLEYWNGEINDEGDNNKQTLALVQVDAAGYLYGWFKAAFFDNYQNEECRIRAGLMMGLQFSFVRGLGYVIK